MILSGGETANSSSQASVNTVDANRAVATHRFHLGGCEASKKKKTLEQQRKPEHPNCGLDKSNCRLQGCFFFFFSSPNSFFAYWKSQQNAKPISLPVRSWRSKEEGKNQPESEVLNLTKWPCCDVLWRDGGERVKGWERKWLSSVIRGMSNTGHWTISHKFNTLVDIKKAKNNWRNVSLYICFICFLLVR